MSPGLDFRSFFYGRLLSAATPVKAKREAGIADQVWSIEEIVGLLQ